MDIWAWVSNLQRELRAAGQFRIADLIDSIPDDAYNGRAERVQAALPEAIAAARALKNPWLEVFFRHHGLNNRLNNLSEGEAALPEAVSLIEFAHREGHMDCPQSVCVTQDIAGCYGNLDGPGWAPDILAVCEETLARINPAWPCFSCISQEYAEALLYAERAAEAVAFLERQGQAILRQGEEAGSSFQVLQARAVWRAGQPDRALTLLDQVDQSEAAEGQADPQMLRQRAILRAHIHLSRGDPALAAQLLPPWAELEVSSYASWAKAAALLARELSERNTWRLGRELQVSLAYLSRVGAHHDAVQVALMHGELALGRGAFSTAQRALAAAQTSLPRLRSQAALADQVAALEASLRHGRHAVSLPVPPEALAEYLRQQDDGDPERDIEWLLAACDQRPDDAELFEFSAVALGACGLEEEARRHLWRYCEAHPEVDGPIYRLMALLLEAQDQDDLERLARVVSAANPQAARWVEARRACHKKQWALAAQHLSAYVQHDPSALGARRLWAQAVFHAGDHAESLRLREELVALQDEPGDDLWDLLATATACQEWGLVRRCCAALGLELQTTEGPVEEQWGFAYLRYDDQGQVRDVYARRTGPVTARVLSPSYAPAPQRLGDWVVFEPSLLEPAPESEEERLHFVPTFQVLHTLQPGGYGPSCFVDGAHPGDEALETFVQAIEARGWQFWLSSGADYLVTDPQTHQPLRGLHFSVTPPRSVTAQELDHALRALTALWLHPVCWPRFAELAGLPIEIHREVVERYRL